MVFVGEEREGEMEFFGEALLRGGGIGADADDAHTAVLQLGEPISQAAGLRGASGGVGLGVEIDEGEAFGVELGELHGVAVLVAGGGVGRDVADCYGSVGLGEAEPVEKVHA